MKVPSSGSRSGWRISSLVFMTKGPYLATGSFSGWPERRRKRARAPASRMKIAFLPGMETSELEKMEISLRLPFRARSRVQRVIPRVIP